MNKREFVLFGASGDLARQKLYPALFDLFDPSGSMRYFGFSRTEMSSEVFRDQVRRSVLEVSAQASSERLDAFVNAWQYVAGSYDASGIASLAEVLDSGSERFFYLSLPSSYEIIASVAEGLAEHECLDERSVVVLEKPFGSDFASAEKLNTKLREYFSEEQMYRIDHYLAKDLVQDVLALRFANPIFEPVWNGEHIERISIDISESEGIRGRGQYYDRSGVIRDMIQNHALQLLAFTVMDQPESLSSGSIHKEKIKVFEKLRLFDHFDASVSIGQYDGYRGESHVDPRSLTETSASMIVRVDSPKWRSVPITITSGKKMKEKTTDITIVFKAQEKSMWKAAGCAVGANRIRINIQPHNDIRLLLNSEFDPEKKCAFPTELRFGFRDNQFILKDPYANALRDVFAKDQSIFINSKEIALSWKFIDEVLAHIDTRREELLTIY